MPARVRVTPFGSLVAVQARGLLMGNRGCLHDDHGEVVRDIASYRGWVTCRLSFNGRNRRPLRKPDWHGRRLWPWRADGYGSPEAAPAGLDMLLLTPPAAVAALREGYMPIIHDSALAAA